VRLSKAFGSTTECWMRIQMHYDLAQIKKRESKIRVNLRGMPKLPPEDEVPAA